MKSARSRLQALLAWGRALKEKAGKGRAESQHNLDISPYLQETRPEPISKGRIASPPTLSTDAMDFDDTDWYPRYYGRPKESWSKTIELHDPDFSVEVFHHEIYAWRKQHPCWTYVSNGLREYQQSEIVFSLLRRAGETVEQYPEAPIEWMRVVCELARQGVHLEIGQPVEVVIKGQPRVVISGRSVPVDEQKWKSMTAFRMFVHGNPLRQRIFLDPPKSFPAARHNVIAFTSEEAELIKSFGVTRVVSHLGLSHKWFPYPPWIDRDRKDCCTLADFENSIRSRLETVQIRGLAATSVKHHVILAIPTNTTSRDTFRSSILNSGPEKPVAFDSYLPPGAVAGAIWKTGDAQPAIYAGKELGNS